MTRVAAAVVLFLLGAAAPAGAATAVADGWMHQRWTTADGLPVNIINDIAQDRDGYLWLATFDGLVRFDGVRFAVFNSTNHPELPSNRFTTVTALADGSLWLSSEQHHLIRFRRGRFRTLDRDVIAIVPAADGSLLVGTGRGLARYRGGRLRPTDAFVEDGVAGLAGEGADESVTFGTLGVRSAWSGERLSVSGSAAWRRASGDVVPVATLASGAAFTVTGAPLAERSVLVDGGLEYRASERTAIGVSYHGVFGDGTRDHGAAARLSVRF